MKSIRSKIKKTNILIRARKAQLSEETRILNSIRLEKLDQLKELDFHQRNYMSGVNDLNNERQSSTRAKIHTLERCVDHSKSQWYKSLRQVKNLEQKEKAQIELVLIAQRNLKSVEIMYENYSSTLKKEMKKREQKDLDEFSVTQFATKR